MKTKMKTNYANIIKQDEKKDVDVPLEEISDEYIGIKKLININNKINKNYKNESVRNQIPRPNNNIHYDVWEHTYFQHILNLHDIFVSGVKKMGVDIETDTFNFLYVFGNFLRECSSGEISPHIEDLSENLDDFYLEYTIKRDDI